MGGKKGSFRILGLAFILTVSLFASAVIINYGLDFYRVDSILASIVHHEIGSDAYQVEMQFVDTFGGNKCEVLHRNLRTLKEEIHQVGIDLSTYGTLSLFKKKDFDYLKRRYFLLEIKFYTLINQMGMLCDQVSIPILFFYEVDHADSETQGYILDNLGKAYATQIVVLALDKDYEDEPLVQMLVDRYNVTKAPTIIIDSSIKKEGLHFEGQLNATLVKLIYHIDPYSLERGTAGEDVGFTTSLTEEELVLLSESVLSGELDISQETQGLLLLSIGRLLGNDTLLCSSLTHFDKAGVNVSSQKKASLFEGIASIGCGRNTKAFFFEAANYWEELGMGWRSEVSESLAYGEKVISVEHDPTLLSSTNYFGSKQYVLVKKIKDEWYTHNEEGVFIHPVHSSLVYQPQHFFLREDLVLLTHSDFDLKRYANALS